MEPTSFPLHLLMCSTTQKYKTGRRKLSLRSENITENIKQYSIAFKQFLNGGAEFENEFKRRQLHNTNRSAVEWIKLSATETIDYGSIPGPAKPKIIKTRILCFSA